LPSLKFKLKLAAQGFFFDKKKKKKEKKERRVLSLLFAVPPGKVKSSLSFLKCFGRHWKKKRFLVRRNIVNESAHYGKSQREKASATSKPLKLG